MKPIAISSCLALAALSLFAADPQTATPATPSATQATHVQTVFSQPQAPGVVDSPLVRAAKATGRLNKKPTQVITNETLVHEGGHFTTPSPEAQAKLPTGRGKTGPTLDEMAADARRARAEAAIAAEQAKKSAAQKKYAAGLAAARAEGDTAEGLYVDPPAVESPTVQTLQPASMGTMEQQQTPQKPPL
jgi:hypothetical protein